MVCELVFEIFVLVDLKFVIGWLEVVDGYVVCYQSVGLIVIGFEFWLVCFVECQKYCVCSYKLFFIVVVLQVNCVVIGKFYECLVGQQLNILCFEVV